MPAAGAMAETDNGISPNLLFKAKLSGDWFIISRSNLATRDGVDDNFFGYTGAGLGYQISREWSVRAGYRHAWFRPGNEWLQEDRPWVEAYYARMITDFRLSSRSRVEFRLFDYRDNDVRFRNNLTLDLPWKMSPLRLQPYVEEEFFYSFDNERIDMNWLGGGLSWKPAKGMKLKLGYRWNYFRVGDDFQNRNTLVGGMNFYL
jgi:opacity protein-like surface antigen